MNANFVFNSVLALRLPYSTLAATVQWRPDPGATVNATIMNTKDSSLNSGLGNFGDGQSLNVEGDFKFDKGLGGANAGVLYSFSQNFHGIGSYVFNPGEGIQNVPQNDTWAAYFSGWQYLAVNDDPNNPPAPIPGIAKHDGIGLFARWGFADTDTNPVRWSISGGLGGRGGFAARRDDTYGLGFVYNQIQTTLLSGFIGLRDNTQGIEGYYRAEITPAAFITLDGQSLTSIASSRNASFVLGARLNLRF